MFGTLASPCGPGDASGATDVGVTDESITVTSYSDSTNQQVPNLNKGIDQSAKAFVDWCNERGGINGRQVDLKFRDAALLVYPAVVDAACKDSISLTGGLAVLDDMGVQAQIDCKLPNIPAAAVSSKQSGADLTFQVLPSPPNQLSLGGATYIKEQFPEVIESAGYIHGDIASLDYITNRMKEALTSIGYNFVYDGKTAIFEQNWPQFAIAMKNAGVKYMTVSSTWEEIIGLQAAMAEQNYEPDITMLETNFYQLKYPAAANGNAEGSYVQLTTWPFTEADDNPAMADYLAALEAANPGLDVKTDPEQLGVQSFSAFLMWATAVKNLGSNVTRAGLVEELKNIHVWDGGGLHGTSDPGQSQGSPCFIMMQVKGDGFERVFPTKEADSAAYEAGKGFSCNPDYVVDLTTNWDNGIKVAG